MIIIENADATPPHLDVFVRLGSSVGVHGSLQFFAFGLLSLFHLDVFVRLGSSVGMLCVCGFLRSGCTAVCCVLSTAEHFGSVFGAWGPISAHFGALEGAWGALWARYAM